jgi:hypothetical protein
MMIIFLRAISVCTNRSDGVPSDIISTSNELHAVAPSVTENGVDSERTKPLGTGSACVVRRAGRSDYLMERCLHESPGLLQLAAFFFANGSLLGGPFFEFKDWDDFLHRRGQFYEVGASALLVVVRRKSMTNVALMTRQLL